MFEFGVRVCGGRSSPGGTVRADVTPPCLESGGEDRPSYVRAEEEPPQSPRCSLGPSPAERTLVRCSLLVVAVAGTATQVDPSFWDWLGRHMVEMASKMPGDSREDRVPPVFSSPSSCL